MTEGTILVIGATGFIGRAVAERLSSLGYRVIGTGRSATSNGCDLELEVGDDAAIEKCAVLGDIDVVVNCAGLAHQFRPVPAREFVRINADGAANGMRIAIQARARRYVLLSSVAVYGDHGDALVDETFECRPQGDYAVSKHLGELRVNELATPAGPEVVIIRPSTVIGVGDRGNTMRLAESIEKRRFVWIGKGANLKSLVARDDVADAVVRTITSSDVANGIYNVSAPPIAMREIVDELAGELGRSVPRIGVPEELFRSLMRLNARTLSIGALNRLDATASKFLSTDRFDAGRFDARFGALSYRSIPEVLRDAVRAKAASDS